jgi:general stress protein YciG
MARGDSLVPFRPGEKAREAGRKGGKKSGEAKRARKKVAEELSELLNLTIKGNLQIGGANIKVGRGATYQSALLASVISNAIVNGDVGDLKKIVEILGEMPKEEKNDTDVDMFIEAVCRATERND